MAKIPRKQAAPAADDKAIAALRDACERNCPAGFARVGYVGQDPLASGRLLRWEGDELSVESLQIIGHDVTLRTGDRLEGFTSVGEKIVAFTTTIRSMSKPVPLNERFIIQSLVLEPPRCVEFGDRRVAYRANVGLLGDEYPADLWLLDRVPLAQPTSPLPTPDASRFYTSLRLAAQPPPLLPEPAASAVEDYAARCERDAQPDPASAPDATRGPAAEPADSPEERFGSESPRETVQRWRTLAPTHAVDWAGVIERLRDRDPHARVRVADVTPNGLGVTMYGVTAMQLHRFERVAMATTIEGHEIAVVAEIRRAVELSQQRCKVGLLLVHPAAEELRAPVRRRLEQLSMMVQREQLRRRRQAG